MDMMTFLTWFGAGLSIIGAAVSIWQAIRSQSAAKEAQRIRAQMIDHREAAELSQVQASCKKAQKSMEKYGPASIAGSLNGISPEKDAGDVQEFIFFLREQRAHFGMSRPNEADQFCEILLPLLDDFAQAANTVILRDFGKQIAIHLSSISAVIKMHLDGKRESVR